MRGLHADEAPLVCTAFDKTPSPSQNRCGSGCSTLGLRGINVKDIAVIEDVSLSVEGEEGVCCVVALIHIPCVVSYAAKVVVLTTMDVE